MSWSVPTTSQLLSGELVIKMSPSPPWVESLDALWDAASLPDAQNATADLLLVAVPGGSAVDPSVGSLVTELRHRATLIATHPYRPYVVATLFVVATWIGAWRNVASVNPRLAAEAEHEHMISVELSRFCRGSLDLLADEDAETRAMMSLLVGAGWPTDGDGSLLFRLYAAEIDPRVRACVMQALVRYVGRLGDPEAISVAEMVNRLLATATGASLARAQMEVSGIWWMASDRRRLAERLLIPAVDAIPVLWPAENI